MSRTAFAAVLSALALAAIPARASVFYGVYAGNGSQPDAVYTIDPNTGAATHLVNTTGGLFLDNPGAEFYNGKLYITSYRTSSVDSFGTVDLTTGAFTPIVAQPITPGDNGLNWAGLAVNRSTGLFYGSTFSELVSITTGGVVTVVGTTGVSLQGLAYDDNAGILYGISTGSLYKVNTSTGAATLVGSTGISGVNVAGLAFDDSTNTLYMDAGSTRHRLYTVNTSTGTATSVGSNGIVLGLGIAGLAIDSEVPEPSSLSLVGGAGALLWLLRRRRS